jgi:hypothetical protein
MAQGLKPPPWANDDERDDHQAYLDVYTQVYPPMTPTQKKLALAGFAIAGLALMWVLR